MTVGKSESLSTPAILVLEDGRFFRGTSIGATGATFGEIVFNTAATGYQEILTDPSYCGQVVMMTYPEIGNYGVHFADSESERCFVSGFVVRQLSRRTSSWRAEQSLEDFLRANHIVGIEGIDTRALTRHIREKGAMRCGITTENIPISTFIEQIQAQPGLEEQDLVSKVTTPKPYVLTGNTETPEIGKLAVLDFGTKRNILASLQSFVGEIHVLPAHTGVAEILALNPDGVFLSNGPGDPAVLHGAIATAKELMVRKIPTFGICLGHQILSLASGAAVEKMPFGHHGGNHPVKDLETGKITITSQNHGYAVVPGSFSEEDLIVTHINLNDQTIEGIRHRHVPMSSVQFHPEANPGPHDAYYLFSRFIQDIKTYHSQLEAV